MVEHTRKKNSRMRGSKTHGYGSMKKHRGAGHRGGRGNAGSGKRADTKKPSIWAGLINGKDPSKIGFNSIMRKNFVTMNVGHLSSVADKLVIDGKAKETAGVITIDLKDIGVNKLLGAGKVIRKLNISVYCSVPGAVAKVKAAGGSVKADIVVDKVAVKANRDAVAVEKKAAKKRPAVQLAPVAKAKGEKE